jgi:hypothetical protein
MFAYKMGKFVAVALLAAGLLTGVTGLAGLGAFADKPAPSKSTDGQATDKNSQKPKADTTDKPKKEQVPAVHGTVASSDAEKLAITVNIQVNPQRKQTEQRTYAVDKNVTVVLEESLKKKEPPATGKFADISPGTVVTLELSPDGKTVTRISARGPGVLGHVKAVSAANRTLTIGVKQKDGLADLSVTLADGAKILLSDGLSKQEPAVEGKLSDLEEGTPVHVQLSVDRKRTLGIQVQGVTLHGYLKSYDTVNNTLIVTTKGENGEEDRTFAAVKNAQLIDLLPGAPVTVRLSVLEKDKIAHAQGHKGN